MGSPRLAAQLFSLRPLLQDRSALKLALARLKKGGYDAVEAVPLDFITFTDLAAEIRSAGLDCCAFHQSAAELTSEPELCAERVQVFGCAYCVTALPAGHLLDSADEARRWGAALGKMAAGLAAAGLSLAYHPHQHEHQRFQGHLALDLIAEAAGPSLRFELDTFWTQRCGLDPARECARLGGRVPLLHLKDIQITPAGEAQTASVGSGNLDWPGIFAASAACQWWIAEQSHFSGDPVDSLLASREFVLKGQSR